MSLSICLWRQNGLKEDGSHGWKEIERCYGYSGHEDGTVKCRWKEIFSKKPDGKRMRKVRKKRGVVKSRINISVATKRIKN
jgi:hypothetical protein